MATDSGPAFAGTGPARNRVYHIETPSAAPPNAADGLKLRLVLSGGYTSRSRAGSAITLNGSIATNLNR